MNNQDKEFSELVGEALGRASVAWSELPTGIFDSDTCCVLHREIMNAHDSLIKKIKDYGYATCNGDGEQIYNIAEEALKEVGEA